MFYQCYNCKISDNLRDHKTVLFNFHCKKYDLLPSSWSFTIGSYSALKLKNNQGRWLKHINFLTFQFSIVFRPKNEVLWGNIWVRPMILGASCLCFTSFASALPENNNCKENSPITFQRQKPKIDVFWKFSSSSQEAFKKPWF